MIGSESKSQSVIVMIFTGVVGVRVLTDINDLHR